MLGERAYGLHEHIIFLVQRVMCAFVGSCLYRLLVTAGWISDVMAMFAHVKMLYIVGLPNSNGAGQQCARV